MQSLEFKCNMYASGMYKTAYLIVSLFTMLAHPTNIIEAITK